MCVYDGVELLPTPKKQQNLTFFVWILGPDSCLVSFQCLEHAVSITFTWIYKHILYLAAL